MLSLGPLRRPLHFSNLENESGMGSFWRGLSRSTRSSFSRPVSELKSLGSRWRTTDLAAPERRCQIFGAASFFSLSFRAHSNHLQDVANASKELGSPSHNWDLLCGHQPLPPGSPRRSPGCSQSSAYHESGLLPQENTRSNRGPGATPRARFTAGSRAHPVGWKRVMSSEPQACN